MKHTDTELVAKVTERFDKLIVRAADDNEWKEEIAYALKKGQIFRGVPGDFAQRDRVGQIIANHYQEFIKANLTIETY